MLYVVALVPAAFAGGSGLNVLVVVNQNSTNSVQLGNYYCEQRGVPPQNLLRINWAGGNTTWTRAEFENTLRSAVTTNLASRQLTNQIDYVVLSMDIPYRVTNTTVNVANNFNSTTAALFYGFKDNPADPMAACSLAAATTSLYAGSEGIFRQTPPISTTSNSWLVMMLTSSNLAQAKLVVDRGMASDFAFPTQTVFLTKSSDALRNIRFLQADDTIFNTRLRGNCQVVLTNTDTPSGLGPLLGFQSGKEIFGFGTSTVVPGAMLDNLTSFGGFLFEPSGHTTALDFLNNGATASYGTIVEPCAYLEKFPTAQNHFYQARGFSIAECYYQSLTNPYQGILVGEPLAAPFALPANGSWGGLPDGAVLAGTTNLNTLFSSGSVARPVQQVDLFLDGRLLHSVSNIPPRQNNILSATINGFTTSYTVPTSATIKSVTSGLVAQLNGSTYGNSTKVVAFAHGDRIELQSLNLNAPGPNLTVTTSNALGSASLLTTFIAASRTNFIETLAFGLREFTVVGRVVAGDYLRLTVTRTNGLVTTVSVTNQTPSSGNIFTDMQMFAQSFLSTINTNAALAGADGVIAEDLRIAQSGNDPAALFNLRARTVGWRAAQILVQLTGSFLFNSTRADQLEDNLSDLRPRNHLYITAGLTNLNLTFPFNTTTNADGYHELTAVAYEGSHVRTQKRISQNVRIANNGWSATLTTLLGGTNIALEATMQFTVVATTNSISKIELFSTGGSLGVSNSVNSTTFAIAASYLGVGLHPVYAVITRSDGKQYRTDTKWIRIVGAEPPFPVTALNATPLLTWPATAGRSYQILSTTNLANGFILRGGATPTNATGVWAETNNSSRERFYRVKTP